LVAQRANHRNFAQLVVTVMMLGASVEVLLGRRAQAANFEQQLEVLATERGLSYCDLSLRHWEWGRMQSAGCPLDQTPVEQTCRLFCQSEIVLCLSVGVRLLSQWIPQMA
jgi:hypothetical protein